MIHHEADYLFIRGLIIGVAVAAPIGPVGLLCIRRTFSYGTPMGLMSGCGAATVDAFYGAISVLGLSYIAKVLETYSYALKLVGLLVIIWLGSSSVIAGFRKYVNSKDINLNSASGKYEPNTLSFAFTSTMLLTAVNPLTLLSFAGIVAVSNNNLPDLSAGFEVVFGIFSGSMLWWVLFLGAIGSIRKYVSNEIVASIEILSGLTIVLIGFRSVI